MKVYEVITNGLNISMRYGDENNYCKHSLEIGDLIFIDESNFYVKDDFLTWPNQPVYKSCELLRKIRFTNSKAYLNEDKVLCTESFFDIIDDINILNPKINTNSIKKSIELGHIKQSVDWERHIKLEELGI